ncbi:hypothetical protein BD626DRAFT_188294 [Schizophyllum amplum]|uniref:RanBD1 domain-containing protein n=1 Tax=Schizophyllum amplum TaxID=97359 RepID=A0A550C092_9AGAR|nr:hypothetical protein BD626DRAFT_188294 [Auriculariopsis ampla]
MGPAGHDNATAGPVEVAALEQPVAVAPESMTASSGSKEDEVKKSATTCPKTPPAHPKMPETPKPTPARRGFAAFAGSASPFATLSTPKASSSAAPSWASPRATPGGASPPAWLSPTTPAWAKRDSGSPPSPNGKQPVALVPQVYATPVAQGQTTGEENEDATAEIRGVRLYTKRGAKGFSEGIVGTMKLLRHKETQKQRLLFRRDPLWQVVMNVRMQEGMRCAYDAEERVVRIVTRETSNEAKAEIVVYAVKPSRSCPKDKFAKFAQDITAVVSSLSSPA